MRNTYEVVNLLEGHGEIDDVGVEHFESRAAAVRSARKRSKLDTGQVIAVHRGSRKTDLFHYGQRFMAR